MSREFRQHFTPRVCYVRDGGRTSLMIPFKGRYKRVEISFNVELKGLPPGDRFRRRVLALSGIRDPAGQLRARIGDRGAERLLAVLRLRIAAIPLPTEYHADLDAYALALKRGRDHEQQENHDEGNRDPNRLLHAKKFPIRRNLA